MKKRKTPPAILQMMTRQQATLRYVDEILALKALPESVQPTWVKESTVEYWVGMANGVNEMLEGTMHEFGCYAGYAYQGKTAVAGPDEQLVIPTIGPTNPEYQSWRRIYFVNK